MSDVPPQTTHLGPLRIIETYLSYDGPKLFACETPTGQVYMALFVADAENSELYLYVAVSPARWRLMRRGGMPIRTVFAAPESRNAYLIRRSLIGGGAEVEIVRASEIEDDWLPSPDATLNLSERLGEPFSPELLSLEALRTQRPVAALQLTGSGSIYDFSLRPLGSLMHLLQENVEAFALDVVNKSTATGPIPRDILYDAELSFAGLYAGSVVLMVTPRTTDRLFAPPVVAEALERIRLTMAATNDSATLKSTIAELGPRSLAKYRDLLEEVADQSNGVTLYIASEAGDSLSASLDYGEVRAALEAVRTTEAQPSETVEIEGLLVGVNMRTYVFELYDESHSVKIAGKILDEARQQIPGLTVGERYRATILREQEIAPLTGEATTKHRLIQIQPL